MASLAAKCSCTVIGFLVILLGGLSIMLFQLSPHSSLKSVLSLDDDRNEALMEQMEYAQSQWSFALILGRDLRVNFLSPFLQILVALTAFLSSLVAADRLFHFYLALYWRLLRQRPEDMFLKVDPLKYMEGGEGHFPKVVVQIPMFNEREGICWTVAERKAGGVNIEERWRTNRQGYKAGAMCEAVDSIQDCEYTAIFDADFKPEPDFLLKTIPYLMANADVAFVQTRWIFANASESILTRVQEISLNYHLKCEQYSRFASGNFFNFNGTAGVWRIKAINDAGGWNNRTTVEDMDLSLRAYLQGWKFIFLNDVECICEIPSTYAAYRHQQHRWSCGPMQLWRKAMVQVWQSHIHILQKLYLNIFFFGTRLFATHIVSFVFYCTLVPICVVAPEVIIPYWALVYVPMLVTISTVAFTPRQWFYVVHYVLFENAMSIVKLSAMLSGLLGLSSAHSWVVTTKLGNWVQSAVSKKDGNGSHKLHHTMSLCTLQNSVHAWKLEYFATTLPSLCAHWWKVSSYRIYDRELGMAIFIFASAAYGIMVESRWEYSVFLILQSLAFAAFGLNLIDNRTTS
eukprot:jgi/Mesen1/10913/ME000095S10255